MSSGLRVVVVGAGTGGCATALLLARRGARVTVLERVTEPRAVGAGIALAPNGLAVLDGLGALGGLEAGGNRLDTPRIVDAAGRTLLAPRFEGLVGDARLVVVRRSDLQSTLLDALAGEPGIELRLGAEVAAADSSGVVTLQGGERLVADLVVGADGVHSRVRDGAEVAARVRRSGIRYVRGLGEGHRAEGVEAWTAAGLFGSFPLPGGTYFFSSAGTSMLADSVARRDLDGFRALWRRAYPAAERVLELVGSFDQLLVNEVIEVRCGRYHDRRLALVGDAAHAMAPNLGQGANSALVDAAVLAAELDRAANLSTALAAYSARRREPVTRVQRDAARLGRLAELTNPLARLVRDRILMPLAAAAAGGPAATQRLLQEDPSTLRTIASGEQPLPRSLAGSG